MGKLRVKLRVKSRLYEYTHEIGQFPLLDKMNEHRFNWFSIEKNKILCEFSIHPGSGGTYVHYIENEDDEPIFESIKIVDEYKIADYIEEKLILERLDSPNPSKELTMFLREDKIKRILNEK
jgi:hypothetical protein